MKKITIRLDEKLLTNIDEKSNNRSLFIREAIIEKLNNEKENFYHLKFDEKIETFEKQFHQKFDFKIDEFVNKFLSVQHEQNNEVKSLFSKISKSYDVVISLLQKKLG